MKRRFLTLLLSVLGMPFLFAQNMVPNPSLETTSPCPTGGGQINYAAAWTSYMNSPDYYHGCGSGNFTAPGPNLGGTQTPAHGNAYVAMVGRHSSAFYREHMGAMLLTPTVPGTSYDCRMKVSLTDISQYAADRIGFLFTTTPGSNVGNFAHVYSTSIITDKNGWATVSGSFTATAAYSYVVIGNFYDDANTAISSVTGGWYAGAYYYVDSISVVPAVVLPTNQVHLDLLETREGKALLGWTAQEGHAIEDFLLERSLDGGFTFAEVARQVPNAADLYRQTDAPGRFHVPVLYRVRSIDAQGGTHLSNTVEAVVTPGGQLALDLFPNPVERGESVTARFNALANAPHQLEVFDLPGRSVFQAEVPSTEAGSGIQLSTETLSTGTYLVKVSAGSVSETKILKVIK